MDRLILRMHPKHKKQSKSNGKENVGGSKNIITEQEKKQRLFPGLALPDQEWQPAPDKAKEIDVVGKEVDDLMAQLENVGKKPRPRASDFVDDAAEPTRKRQRISPPVSPPRRQRSPEREDGYERSRSGRYDDGPPRGRPAGRNLDERPVLYKIYDGKVTGLKDFGAFVSLEGIRGRAEGLVHVSAIQTGARVNAASDLLARNQLVKVKVMSVAGSRISLSMKDVDQASGRDLTPHLRIKSEAELIEEERLMAKRAASGSNSMPLGGGGGGSGVTMDTGPVRSAKRLTSPERWEIKQLISSGAIDASEYPELDEDFNSPMARAEIEEELDVEVRDDEPAFLAGQTKRTLDLSPVKIIKAPDGSLNRAAMAGASLQKERRELKQQEANEAADSETRDFSTPWQDPMAQQSEKIFAQDLRGNLLSEKNEVAPEWRKQAFNKATTFGKITSLSIGDQRKSLPIFKLREPLLEAIRDNQVLIVPKKGLRTEVE
ncbi:hypothetical protein SISNIDRAFT_176775 [Sistotremastrum niveocremeum HHB9708]|uniref:S1 motif domain-containing protein n=1 Tax=Sistotremastrum niveocremeum HHB9708 TaxID=1314777 RepID=A0A164RRC7_9AGAM|nr:hypothetical protein SISNIDRAFT_176775 [Sistotremastrum niveocremeum HHB9708]